MHIFTSSASHVLCWTGTKVESWLFTLITAWTHFFSIRVPPQLAHSLPSLFFSPPLWFLPENSLSVSGH
uniref:Uncharacterized protein n=1 Tax=Salix viminalis TaxID=40686 RepID=A0A6N2L4S9_SALVM